MWILTIVATQIRASWKQCKESTKRFHSTENHKIRKCRAFAIYNCTSPLGPFENSHQANLINSQTLPSGLFLIKEERDTGLL